MTILDALKLVASRDGDRARSLNGVGFSGQDTHFANTLAEKDSLSPKMEVYAAKFVRKYRKQVFAFALAVEKASPSLLPNIHLIHGATAKGKKLNAVIDGFLGDLAWQHRTFDFNAAAEQASEPKPSRGKISGLVGERTNDLKGFVVRMPRYDAELVAAIKALPNRQYKDVNGDKKWTVGATAADVTGLARLVVEFNLEASDECRRLLGLV